MRQGGGKQKGADYERYIAGVIGKWWCNDERAFWRTHGSGAMVTVNKGSGLHPGDIYPIKQVGEFPFCCELKKQEGWSFDEFIKNGNESWLGEYWFQCKKESAGKIPWLIFSKNRTPNYLMMQYKFSQFLFTDRPLRTLVFRDKKMHIVVADFDKFLEIFKVDQVKQAAKEYYDQQKGN